MRGLSSVQQSIDRRKKLEADEELLKKFSSIKAYIDSKKRRKNVRIKQKSVSNFFLGGKQVVPRAFNVCITSSPIAVKDYQAV